MRAAATSSELVLSVLRKDLGLGLDLLADALLRPAFPDAEFERKRDEVLASVQRSEEDPGAVAARAAEAAGRFPSTPTAAPWRGPRPRSAPSPGTTWLAFHRAAYRPERTIVAVAGDVTAAAVRAELEARLGAWSVAGAGPGGAGTGAPRAAVAHRVGPARP